MRKSPHPQPESGDRSLYHPHPWEFGDHGHAHARSVDPGPGRPKPPPVRITDAQGHTRELSPSRPTIVFVEERTPGGMTPSGIVVNHHDDLPKGDGIVRDFLSPTHQAHDPKDRAACADVLPHLSLGCRVIYPRYASDGEQVCLDYQTKQVAEDGTRVRVGVPIIPVHVLDILAVLD